MHVITRKWPACLIVLIAGCGSTPAASLAGDAALPATGTATVIAPSATPSRDSCLPPNVPARRASLTRVDLQGRLLWHADLPTPEDSGGAAPVLDEQRAYVEVTGGIRAYDQRTGELRWEVPVRGAGIRELVRTPRLLVVHGWEPANRGSYLLALDPATGEQRWLHHTGDTDATAIVGSVVPMQDDADGPITALAWGTRDTTVTALDLATGRLRWTAPGDRSSGPGPVATAGTVVIARRGGTTAYDSRSGTVRWQVAGDGQEANATLAGDLVLVKSRGPDNDPQTLTALRVATGEQVWQRTTAQILLPYGTVPGGVAVVAVVAAGLYRDLSLLDSTSGRTRWTQRADANPDSTALPVSAGLARIEGPFQGPLSVVARGAGDGTVLWRAVLPPYATELVPMGDQAVLTAANDVAVAVDARDGHRLWASDVDPVKVKPGGLDAGTYIQHPVADARGALLLAMSPVYGCSFDDRVDTRVPVSRPPTP